jgi:hypothetical protein
MCREVHHGASALSMGLDGRQQGPMGLLLSDARTRISTGFMRLPV